jgi:hypothetical protein
MVYDYYLTGKQRLENVLDGADLMRIVGISLRMDLKSAGE